MYEIAPALWVRLASLQFTGPAARWLSSMKSSIRKFTWSEFCQEVVLSFGRNQHQSLIRWLYKLVQTGTVEEYVQQFVELMDQLAAYEDHPDVLHYVTRFIDGLKPQVRVLVAVQLPQDLETAYTIACVHEEVTDGNSSLFPGTVAHPRRNVGTMSIVSRQSDERRSTESVKSNEPSRSYDDKLLALKNYRRAKGLCITCGERWAREHKCQPTVQLHVVQEMVEFLHSSPEPSSESSDTVVDMELMQIVADQALEVAPEQSIVLQCSIQGKEVIILLDSGSSNSFIRAKLGETISGHVPLSHPRKVKVAGGGIL
jgi:hypothetical protein